MARAAKEAGEHEKAGALMKEAEEVKRVLQGRVEGDKPPMGQEELRRLVDGLRGQMDDIRAGLGPMGSPI